MSEPDLLLFAGGPCDGQQWVIRDPARDIVVPELPFFVPNKTATVVNHRYRRTKDVQDGRTVYRYVVPK